MVKIVWPFSNFNYRQKWSALNGFQRASFWTLGISGLIVLLYLFFSLLYLGKVYPHVYIGGQSYSGLTREQVKQKLTESSQAALSKPLTLKANNKTSSLNANDISYHLDIDKTVDTVFSYGRQDSFWQSLQDQISSLFIKQLIQPVAVYDQDAFDQHISAISQTFDQPAVDASAKIDSDKLITENEKSGIRINPELLKDDILNHFVSFSSETIELTLQVSKPSIILGDPSALEQNVETLSNGKLTLAWPSGSKTLTRKEIRQLIGFVADPTTNQNGAKLLVAQYTPESIETYLQNIATNGINQPAKEPKLIIQDGKLTVSQHSSPGSVVDLDASKNDILSALTKGSTDPVTLTLKAQEPVISENNLDSLGIRERIGYAETSFAGSPANRKANIANGVSILQSALVKPGDEFSTVNTLGAVDNTTGFLPELVIKDNRTLPEFGGGLCQVSTTLFRAVMNAGLKVTERQNHSYRVGYYEPPVGMDATIYLPKPDFRFLNDTGNSILIQGRIEGNKVIFELWGTSDGRSVSLSDPVVSDIVSPPPPLYVQTDTLPYGTTKQVEHEHQGATAVFTYTVTRNGQVINKQTFKSVYKPWQAQFLVGTQGAPPGAVQPPTPSP